MANVTAEVNAVLDHAERVNEVAERYKAEAERNRMEAETARAELARLQRQSGGGGHGGHHGHGGGYRRPDYDYDDHRAYEVAERYARLTEDSLRVLHNEREARMRAEERLSPPRASARAPVPAYVEYVPAPVIAPVALTVAAPAPQPAPMVISADGHRVAELEHLLRTERDKVTYLMLEKDRLENLVEAEKQRHEYERDIMTDELEYRGQEKRYWQWWSTEERQELAQAKSQAEQLRSEADRLRMDLLAEREARQRAERQLDEHRIVTDRSNAELEIRITRSAEDMVGNYRRVIDTLEKQLEVYRRQAMENEVKLRDLTVRAAAASEWRPQPEAVTTTAYSASLTTPGLKETSVSHSFVRAESPVRGGLAQHHATTATSLFAPPPAASASSSYFADQLHQLRRERDEAYSALARYEDIPTAAPSVTGFSSSRLYGSPPRSPRRRFEETMSSRRLTRLSPTKLL